MSGLEAVLAAHRIVRDPFSLLCACGNWRDKRDYDGAQHQAHVAEQIRAHLAGVARDEGVREAVTGALFAWNTPTDPYFVIGGRAGDVSEGDPYAPIADAAVAAFMAAIA